MELRSAHNTTRIWQKNWNGKGGLNFYHQPERKRVKNEILKEKTRIKGRELYAMVSRNKFSGERREKNHQEGVGANLTGVDRVIIIIPKKVSG